MSIRNRFLSVYYKLYNIFNKRGFEELEEFSREFDEELGKEDCPRELPPVPDFEPRRTALFYGKSRGSRIHWYNQKMFRQQIRRHVNWFLTHGYEYIVVNHGTRYGRMALEELVDLRRKGEPFTLCCGKRYGEHWGKLTIDFVFLTCDCDVNFGIIDAEEFKEKVFDKISAASLENGAFFIKDRLPVWVIEQWKGNPTPVV